MSGLLNYHVNYNGLPSPLHLALKLDVAKDKPDFEPHCTEEEAEEEEEEKEKEGGGGGGGGGGR